jgi:hypothetical protein
MPGFTGCGNTPLEKCFVTGASCKIQLEGRNASGHDFSRAEKATK